MCIFPSLYQTSIRLLLISRASARVKSSAGVWNNPLQRPDEMSQVLTTPAESHETMMPSSVCREMDLIEAKASGVDSKFVVTWSADATSICQNLICPWEYETREDENVREMISSVCPTKVSTR